MNILDTEPTKAWGFILICVMLTWAGASIIFEYFNNKNK